MNDDRLLLEVNTRRMRKLEDRLQYSLLASIFIIMGILEHMPHHTAKVAVLYFCGFLLCMTIITGIISIKAHKLIMQSIDVDLEEIKKITKRNYDGIKQK